MADSHGGDVLSLVALIDACIKGGLLLGTVALLGSALFRRWVAPELASGGPSSGNAHRAINAVSSVGTTADTPTASSTHSPASIARGLRGWAWVGACLVVVLSGLNLTNTLLEALGYVDGSLFADYLFTTTHGRASAVRALLAVLLAVLALLPTGRLSDVVVAVASVLMLGTFSILSHSAASGAGLPLLADLVHATAAVAWVGAIMLSATLPVWHARDRVWLAPALRRTSGLGLIAVIVLAATGVFLSVLHIPAPDALVATPYGQSLLFKVAVVLTLIGLAAFNRFQMLPDFLSGHDTASLARAMRVESVLLLVVLAATGLLTTSPPPG